MMDLIFLLPLLGYLSYSISNIIDKHIIKKNHLYATTADRMFLDGAWIFLFSIIIGNGFVPYLFEGAILGLLYGIASLLYFELLEYEEAGKAISYLMSANILFSFAGAIIFLHETASIIQYIGVIGIIIGIIAIVKDGRKKIAKIVPLLILGIAIITATYYLLTKAVLSEKEPISMAINMYFFSAIIIAIYAIIKKKKIIEGNPIIIGSSFFGGLGTMLIYLALKYMEATQVYPVSGLQILSVMVLGHITKEEKIDKIKVFAATLLIIGIALVLT